MFAGQDFIIISSMEWDFLWQGPQEIASRLASSGNRVFYIENTGVRTPGLRDARRVASRILRWADLATSSNVRSVSPNLYICSPLVLPPFGGRLQRKFNSRVMLPTVRNAAARLKMRNVVVFTFLPTDTASDLIELFRNDTSAVVYYCVADFAELVARPERLFQTERQVVERSDLVLVPCDALASRWSQWARDVRVIPYGVNLEAFSSPAVSGGNGEVTDDTDVALVPRPIIGYVGGLHRFLDFSLLTSMAKARPDWSWVLIGPPQAPLGDLANLPNVFLFGEVQHRQLANHIDSFDVGIVPYVSSSFTKTVVPTKINEYLAMGKPVVSTALPAVRDRWPGVVLTCEPQLESFIRAIEEALVLPRDKAAKARRREIASHSDWAARFEKICTLIDRAIIEKSGKRQTKAAGA